MSIESRVPAAEYHARPELSISRLKELKRSPLHYLWAQTHPKETAPLTLGKAAHCAVLEPERFGREFAVWENRTEGGAMSPRRGKVWDAYEADMKHQGREIITLAEADLAAGITGAVRNDPVAMKYLQAGEPEVVIVGEIGGRMCRGRVDWLTRIGDEPVIVGLKTARDCRPFIFGSAAAKLGYHLQWAFYQNLYAVNKGGHRARMVEIVVESAPPHAVVVYKIPEDVLLQGEEEFGQLMVQLAECEASGKFPGPATVEQELSLPSWVYQAEDDLSDLALT